MPADFESSYNAFGSRFGNGKASAQRGSFARYLDEGQGNFSQFAGGLNSTFKTPSATNSLEETAFGDAADARNVEQWGANLNRIGQQQNQFAQLGFNATQQVQQVQQAKEMAALNAQSARQGAMFSGISSGLSILGGIGSQFQSGGLFNRPSTSSASGAGYTLPSPSGWRGNAFS